MVKIAIEEFSYQSEVFEPYVQNEKVEVHVYKKVSNDDVLDLFFNIEYIYIFKDIMKIVVMENMLIYYMLKT